MSDVKHAEHEDRHEETLEAHAAAAVPAPERGEPYIVVFLPRKLVVDSIGYLVSFAINTIIVFALLSLLAEE